MSAGLPGAPPRPPLRGGTVAIKPKEAAVMQPAAPPAPATMPAAPSRPAVDAHAATLAELPSDTLVDGAGAGVDNAARGGPSAPHQAVSDHDAFGATVAASEMDTLASDATASGGLPASTMNTGGGSRSTVLPRVENIPGAGTRLVQFERPRYSELRTLGAGGMGEVALVRDEDIQRTVALKRLHASLEHPLTVARFAEEVRTIGSLEHPNIVPVHDVGRDEAGRYFFVMKHVEGETLEHVIERLAAKDPDYVARYTVEARLEIFQGVLHALSYAHERGIVHRDVKPANVMVGRHGEVVLMDWGIAKHVGGAEIEDPASQGLPPSSSASTASKRFETAVGTLIGTPAYMSPEQAAGHNDKIDPRSDLYSACVLLYELLALRHPLEGKTTLEDVFHSVRSEAPSFLDVAKHMPAEWAHFIFKGLRKAPEERFQTASEMLTRIQRTLEGLVPVECHVTATKRLTREASRMVDRHTYAAVSGLFVLMALALVGLGSIVWRVVGG